MPFGMVMEGFFSRDCIAVQQRQDETNIMFLELKQLRSALIVHGSN
jgi:hypothetical protein